MEPTSFLLKQFNTLWTDFENEINNEIQSKCTEKARMFKLLKSCFKTLYDSITIYKKNNVQFQANELFDLNLEENHASKIENKRFKRASSCELNNTIYLKGIVSFCLVLDLICGIEVKSCYEVDNCLFELKGETKESFQCIKINLDNKIKEIIIYISPMLRTISLNYIDVFLKNLYDLTDSYEKEFLTKKPTFSSLGYSKQKYESRVKGCETKCPCCGRLCDTEHYKQKTLIGSQTNKHRCNRGHQFRGFNGYKVERSNFPSFKICEKMKASDLIICNGKLFRWDAYQIEHPTWDFESNESAQDWENKCTHIWSFIGEHLCKKFDMTFTQLAIDSEPSQNQPPLHFILILDDSGSMQMEKWNDLFKSVSNFFKLRSQVGSQSDKVSVIYFSVKASIVIQSSSISEKLYEDFPDPSFGGSTNYSAALERMIQIFENEKLKEQSKFAIVFMSDGKASYPANEVKIIKDKYLDRIFKFWAIGYGNENFSILRKMLNELFGNDNGFKNPQQSLELENVYIEIARDEGLIRL